MHTTTGHSADYREKWIFIPALTSTTVGKSDSSVPPLDDATPMRSSHWSVTTPSASVIMSRGHTGPTSTSFAAGNIVGSAVKPKSTETDCVGSPASLTTVAVPLQMALIPPLHMVITWSAVGGVTGSLRLPIVPVWAWPSSHHPISARAPMSHRRRWRPMEHIEAGGEMKYQESARFSHYLKTQKQIQKDTCMLATVYNNKSVFSLVSRLSVWHLPHLLLSAVLRRRCCWAPAPL